MSNYLTKVQVDQILKPINPSRVSVRDGMSHVEAYEVKAHMARIFGVARWSSEVLVQECIFEEQVQTNAGKPAWYVGYRSVVRLTVCAPDGTQLAVYTEGHAGDSTHPKRGEAHGNAITNSESYAFKRAATMALLDQGGLSLYRKGSRDPLVKRTLVVPEGDEVTTEDVAHDAPPVTPEQGAEEQPVTTHDDSGQATAPTTSADDPSAGRTPPAAPLTPDAAQQEAPPNPANDPTHIAERLRDEALALFHGRSGRKRNEVIQDLGKVNIAAARAKVQMQKVRRENGEEVTLGVFLSELITQSTKAA